MFNNAGSINDSRINAKKCASRNGLKLRSARGAYIVIQPSKIVDGS